MSKEKAMLYKEQHILKFFAFELQLNRAWIHDWELMVATHIKLSLIKFTSY